MMILIVLPLIVIICKFENLNSEDLGIKLGGQINICCSLKSDPNNALILDKDPFRLAALYRNELTKSDVDSFEKVHEGFEINQENNTMCLKKDKATKKEANLTFKCTVVRGMFGSTITSQILRIKIYEELKFIVSPPTITKVATGNNVSVDCVSNGSPNLKTLWRSKDKEVMATGKSSSILFIQNASLSMDGDNYTCEASIKVPPGTPNSTIQKVTTLNIQFKPEILVDVTSVHTDLGIKEIIKIIVIGNPRPTLNCRQLSIEADQVVTIGEPTPNAYHYEIQFNNITLQNIGTYDCTAKNDIGETKEKVTLILGPINCRITSPNETSYSNYYLLKWTVDSKSTINLSKIYINQYNDSINSSSIETTLDGRVVSPIINQSGNSENNWRYSFSVHIIDLSSNKWHRISLQMCSKYQCINATNPVYVQTAIFNGENSIKASELNFAQGIIQKNPNGRSASMTPLLTTVFVLCVLNVIFLDLVRL